MSTPVKSLIPFKEDNDKKYKHQGILNQDEQVSRILLFHKSKAVRKKMNFNTPCYQ